MKHYFAHHSESVMGYPATLLGNPCYKTSKDISKLKGTIVWLTSSEGKSPMSFYIASRFVVQHCEANIYAGEERPNLISGSGLLFGHTVEITHSPLLQKLKDNFANLQGSLSEIKDVALINELENACGIKS